MASTVEFPTEPVPESAAVDPEILPEAPPELERPSYEELVQSVITRLQARLQREDRHLLTRGEINQLVYSFLPREQFFIVHDLADGPLHNLRRRLRRRMTDVHWCFARNRMFNQEGSEDEYSTDSDSLFVNLYTSREADWPRYHANNSDDDFEEAFEAPEHEVPERSEV
jgi:hypothetical protein